MSKDNDIRYNGSGYYDETAYKAMKNMDRGGTHKMSDINNYTTGEIWEMEATNGITKEVILIQCFGNYAAVLTLMDNEPKQNALAVKSLSLKYTDCGRLGYCFYDKLTNYIRTLSDGDIAELKRSIADALELPMPEMLESPQLEKQVETDSALKAAILDSEATQKKCEELREKPTNAEYKATSMTRERDIYKNLYEQILDKVIP